MLNKCLKAKISTITMILSTFLLSACGQGTPVSNIEGGANIPQGKGMQQEVNLYTDRHYESDQKLLDSFTAETGIKVNVVSGKSDELLERLNREGKDTQADLFITTDAGRLHAAKVKQLLAPVYDAALTANVPENSRDRDKEWFGLTIRARVIIYAKDRVNPKELSTYEDLASPKWKGKVLVRPSSNIYNQSLVASFIALKGEVATRNWIKGIVANMAREPKGSDRDQATAVVAGIGDVAIMNTYYIGLMLNSSNPEEVSVAKKVGLFFPNQATDGTHINVSGAGVTKHAKNPENAAKLMIYLTSEKAQKQFADANYEYPVNPKVEPSELLKSWGEFKRQNINLTRLGENNAAAVKVLNEAQWK